jgi:dephospho-CoA kinase
MFLVGLTGGIATGKTQIANIFLQHGIPVIDADKIARQSKQKFSSLLDFDFPKQ